MADPDSLEPSPEVLRRGSAFFHLYPRDSSLWQAVSRCTVFSVGAISKAFLNGLHKVEVLNLDSFHKSIEQAKAEGRGVITVMNHISILDDPLIWGGTLTLRQLASTVNMRWALGAKDIVFRNTTERNFFSLGQILSVERFGRGPDQPAIDAAIALISYGKWVHLYPEGFVHQPYEPFNGTLRYFHWGVSRLILESGPKTPIVVPIYGNGLNDVFPEDKQKRTLGYKCDKPITYAFGDPIDMDQLKKFRLRWYELQKKLLSSDDKDSVESEIRMLRSECASYVRMAVLQTKHKFFKASDHDFDPRFDDPEFWHHQDIVHLKGKTMAQKLEKGKSL